MQPALFPSGMIVKLEMTQSTAQQNNDQTQNSDPDSFKLGKVRKFCHIVKSLYVYNKDALGSDNLTQKKSCLCHYSLGLSILGSSYSTR